MDEKALRIVKDYIESHLDKSDPKTEFDVYTVWKAKVLQNWKYLISSTLPDGMYYELTYNGDDEVWYLDAYKKFDNQMIQVYREKECAFITVGDDGKVIPKELAENMFKPFVSGDASRTSGSGNGLGLAISSTIVEKHGGKLYMKDCGGGYTKKFVVQIQSMS